MDQSKQNTNLLQLINQLKTTPQSATDLFTQHNDLWRALNFNQAQVTLWLTSLPLYNRQNEESPQNEVAPDITDHLVALLQQANGRMPLAQVLKKLPAGVTSTEQQIRKLALQHAQLETKGPLLVLVK
jgi:hypothetical protein